MKPRIVRKKLPSDAALDSRTGTSSTMLQNCRNSN